MADSDGKLSFEEFTNMVANTDIVKWGLCRRKSLAPR